MILHRRCGKVAVVALMGMFCAASRADILVRTDGGMLDGKVVSKHAKEIVFQPDGGGETQHVDAATIARVIQTDEHGAVVPEGSTPTTLPTKWKVPADPVPPAVLKPAKGSTYVVIPLHGEVGVTILASVLEKSLEDALARKPNVVVLDIDSPGGLVEESRQISSVLHRYNKKLRIVALTNQDLSAAAIFSLSVREIYVKSTSTIGAATSYIPGNPNLSAKVEEKMQSAWRAAARNSAEEGKHEPLLAEAMIDNDEALHLETVNGKTVVKEGEGDHILCRKGKILTLSSHEAVECGLAAGEADDVAELGDVLKLAPWTELKALGTLLADALPKRSDAFKTESQKIRLRLQQDLADAVADDPSQSVTESRIVNVGPRMPQFGPPGMPGRHGIPIGPPQMQPQERIVTRTLQHPKSQWKSDSLNCVVALQKAEADLADASSLAQAYGHASEVQMLKEAMDSISGARAVVYDDRNKYGQGVVVASNDRPRRVSVSVPQQHEPRPPAEEMPSQPDESATNRKSGGADRTEQLGSKGGGGPYVMRNPRSTPIIGFQYTLGNWGKPIIGHLDPIFERPSGSPGANQILAKDGFVVGGLVVKADHVSIVAFQVIFVGYQDGVVNAKDNYKTEWFGTPDDSPTTTLAGNGEVVVGTYGRRGMNQDAIGLLIAPNDGPRRLSSPEAGQSRTPAEPPADLPTTPGTPDEANVGDSGAAYQKWIDDKIADLSGDSADLQNKAADQLCLAIVSPEVREKVLAALEPHLNGTEKHYRQRCVLAYGHWATSAHVKELLGVIATPANPPTMSGDQDSWAAAAAALVTINPKLAEGAIHQRISDFFFRVHVISDLVTMSTEISPAQRVAVALLKRIEPNNDAVALSVKQAEELLRSDSADNRTKGAKALTTAVVEPAEQARILALLKTHVMGKDGRARLLFVQAFAHWAGLKEVETLKSIIAFPETVEGLSGQENCWAAATIGLARLDPAAAKEAMEGRVGIFFYRANLHGELTKIAQGRSPLQPTASWLLGLMEERDRRPLPTWFNPGTPPPPESPLQKASNGKRI